MRKLSLEGKITAFKTLVVSKLNYLTLMAIIPNYVISEIVKLQQRFIWSGGQTKIKKKTWCYLFEDGGLKNIPFKIINFQCFWDKKLCDNNSLDWKIIPLHMICRTFGKCFQCHSSVGFENALLSSFSKFYQNIFYSWCTALFFHLPFPLHCFLKTYGSIAILRLM